MTSVATLPSAQANFVSLGVGENPERRGVFGALKCPTRVGGILQPLLHRIMGNHEVEMNSVSLRSWFAHLLKPDRWTDPARVHKCIGV
jgi:hypothetical protein